MYITFKIDTIWISQASNARNVQPDLSLGLYIIDIMNGGGAMSIVRSQKRPDNTYLDR